MDKLINKIFCLFGFHRWRETSSDTRICQDCFKRQKRLRVRGKDYWVDYREYEG